MDSLLKVLLVDDHQMVLEGLRQQLNWERFHGTLCGLMTNGLQAYESLSICQPDVIISDIKMPYMDGIELAKRIFESSSHSKIPIILLSGYREFEYAKNAMQYHVNHYILKPITRQKIIQLEDILIKLYEEKEMSKKNLMELADCNYRENLLNYLRNHNISQIEDFFHSAFYQNCMNGKYNDMIGSQLILLLYDYLTDIRFTKSILDSSRSHTLEQLYELPNSTAKSNYIENLYMDVITLLLHQKNNNSDALYRFALQYIEDHYTDPNFSLSAMADEMNITLSYLSTIFKQSSGRNLNNYVAEKRLELSKKMLQSPSYSIKEIAVSCGYENIGYFSTIFRRKVGMTPSQFRNCHL